MSRISSVAVAALLAVAAPVAGHSQDKTPPTPPSQDQGFPMGHGKMMGDGMMGGRMTMQDCLMMNGRNSVTIDDRLEKLKKELAITDAEQNAWNGYAEQMTANWNSMGSMRDRMQAMWNARTPIERLDAHVAIMDAQLTRLKDTKPKLQALYDSLSADQRAKADKVLSPMGCMM